MEGEVKIKEFNEIVVCLLMCVNFGFVVYFFITTWSGFVLIVNKS